MRARVRKLIISLCLFAAVCVSALPGSAQRVAVKTNLLEWATITPNLGVEARLSRRLTLDVSMTANAIPLKIHDYRLNNVLFQPALRYWFNRPMARHFVSLDFVGGMYNLQLDTRRYKGDVIGGGIGYGYALVLNRHWNVEFEAAVGIARLHGFDWRTSNKMPSVPNMSKWALVPIRLGVNFAYVFK